MGAPRRVLWHKPAQQAEVPHLVHPIAKIPHNVIGSVACIAASGSALVNAHSEEAESSVSAIGGSEGKNR